MGGHKGGFHKLAEALQWCRELGVKERVLGDTSLLPADVLAATNMAEEVTRNNCECTLNVALAYTSREEMTQAARNLAAAVKTGQLKESEVTVERLEAMLYTSPSPPVDLMIRTSGEKRLSDFLLWQSENAIIHFTSVLWPEFSLWHLLAAIFYYQRHRIELDSTLDDVHEKEKEVVEIVDLDSSMAALLGRLATKTD